MSELTTAPTLSPFAAGVMGWLASVGFSDATCVAIPGPTRLLAAIDSPANTSRLPAATKIIIRTCKVGSLQLPGFRRALRPRTAPTGAENKQIFGSFKDA